MNKKEITKQDIKNGAIIILRNGEKYIKIDNTLLELTMSGDYMPLKYYNEDLTCLVNDFDIMKVLNPREHPLYKEVCNSALFDYVSNFNNIKWTYERKEKRKIKLKDMTMEEYEKWLQKKCLGYKCEKCIFEKVKCANNINGWVNNKDLYSEKFLNQEIELED